MNYVNSLRLIAFSLAAIVSMLLLASGATAQVLIPIDPIDAESTLEGETLSGIGGKSWVTCDPNKALLSFEVHGPAVGPFPGAFVEKGFIYFDPVGGKILAVEISFVIYDGSGRKPVVGQKFLQSGVAHCALDAKTSVTTFGATVFLDYSALFQHSGIKDDGEATLDLGGSFFKSGQFPGELMALKFTQIFHSSKVLISTLGKVTGGGNILQTSGGRGVTFGFNAQNTDKGMKGSGSIIDHSIGTTVKIREVTTLVIAGTHATILGTAEVNGVVENFRVDVEDLGEPGADGDSFKIVTDTYGTAGILTGGNIQVHK